MEDQEFSSQLFPVYRPVYRLEKPERKGRLISLLERYGRSYAINSVYPGDWKSCYKWDTLTLYIHTFPLTDQILPANDPQPVDHEVLRESIRLSLQLLRVQIYHDEDGAWSFPPRELALCTFGILAAQGYRSLKMNEDFEHQIEATLYQFAHRKIYRGDFEFRIRYFSPLPGIGIEYPAFKSTQEHL